MTEPTPYFDPFIPTDPEESPPPPNVKVSYYDVHVGQSTPIMKYSFWPNWSRAHYTADGTVTDPWWIFSTD